MKTEIKACQNCRQKFTIEPEDFDFYKKIDVPAPSWCPECREQRRIAFRNERSLYKRKCDFCNKIVVSRVSPDKPYPMYCRDCWWSDEWDPLSYGRDYDFSRPFFEQFKELLFRTPHASLFNQNTVNSDWVNQETDDKNCYLNVGGHYNEDSAYNTYLLYGKDSFDNFWVLRSEFCYENIRCERCWRTLFSEECFDCRDTVFSYDCRNCNNVMGCAGLRNRQYCIFNQQYTKESYDQFLREHPLTSYKSLTELRERAHKVWCSVPHRYALVVNSRNASGHMIHESKNATNCWDVEKVEDSKNLYIAGWIKDSHDETSHGASELSYECSSGGGAYHAKFLVYCMSGDPLKKFHTSFMEYCYSVVSSQNCFGCANMRNQEYCILNKKYSKEKYEKLVPKIKEHMQKMPYRDKVGRSYDYGEFYPIELSPFGYNETAAQDYYPLTKEEAMKRGYPWSDYESEISYQFSDYVVPDDLSDVGDGILNKVLKCEVSGKPYRVIPMELQFYRRIGLPIPRRAPLQRHKDRIARLLPRRLYNRTCECGGSAADKGGYKNTVAHFHGVNHCPNAIQTPYNPKRQEIVYCEQCYQAEVV